RGGCEGEAWGVRGVGGAAVAGGAKPAERVSRRRGESQGGVRGAVPRATSRRLRSAALEGECWVKGMKHAGGRRALALLTAVLVPAVLLTVVGSAFGAGGASISSASLSGASGTFTNGSGTVFAKQGGLLTLAVSGSSIACVVLANGDKDHAAPFSFPLTAAAGDGPVSVTATAYPNYNSNNGNCSGNSDSKTVSYQLDNTGPVVSGSVSPAPN